MGATALSDRHGGRWDLRGGLQLLLHEPERRWIWPAGTGERAPETDYMAAWTPGVARLAGRWAEIDSELEVFVHPEFDCELRRLRVTNAGARPRRLELSAYLEPVLLPAEAHEAHPAFAKLFLQTRWLAAERALTVRRRPRSPAEEPRALALAMPGSAAVAHESDRARLLPRGAGARRARFAPALAALGGHTGSVLDPALCLRRELTLAPGERSELLVLLGAAGDESALPGLLAQAGAAANLDSALEGARTSQRHILEELGLDAAQAAYLEQLAAALLLEQPGLWPPASDGEPLSRALLQARLGFGPERSFLFAEAARLAPAELDLLRRGQLYWQTLALPLDLVLVEAAGAKSGNGYRSLQPEGWPAEELAALAAAARLAVGDRLPALRPAAPVAAAWQAPVQAPAAPPPTPPAALSFFNGIGGFSADGREYSILLPWQGDALRLPPRPWINVVANEDFGFLFSETGAGYTWRGNSREHRLTPWSNDPVLDPPGEAFYLRDEESGAYWSPLPGPAPAPTDYTLSHGIGYSRCCVEHDGLALETRVFAAAAAPLRFTEIRLRNGSARTRRLSLWAHYTLWLGGAAAESRRHLRVEAGEAPGDLRARRRSGAGPIAFAAARGPASSPLDLAAAAGDRAAFLGPALDLAAPSALQTGRLGDMAAAGDPCFTQALALALEPGAETLVCFLFGEADSDAEVAALCAGQAEPADWAGALAEAQAGWASLCARVQVRTPDPALDLLVNAWLPYQTLSCRLRGRSAFYQSGGAFGFRDQLQDAGAFLLHEPALARRQLLLHAAHQFDTGDVMHWWHPRLDIGLRTRFADDLLWLPLLTAEYLAATGEGALLDEAVDFLVARPLAPGEDEALLPVRSAGRPASLYEHCCRAIDRSLALGAHGLPLFGSGDWNDGMNRVGRAGQGESVWMGFFLVSVLDAFLPYCAGRSDAERAARYRAHRQALVTALESAGWDGEWYRRGYYDDGTPLGAGENDECRIDALVQAWSVLSGAADPERARLALAAAESQLVDEDAGLIRLLWPPFDRAPQDPGYIKGYVPGVRENGGQYTHAALWLVRAFAALGRRDRVAPLLALLNPIRHAATPAGAARYQVEPYVMAADVYGVAPHVGRGGWTWYTGASGWMLRVALESLLGLRREAGQTLCVAPCIPDAWTGYTVRYRPFAAEATQYRLEVSNPQGRGERVVAASLDGRPLPLAGGGCRLPLVDDGHEHSVAIRLGPAAETAP